MVPADCGPVGADQPHLVHGARLRAARRCSSPARRRCVRGRTPRWRCRRWGSHPRRCARRARRRSARRSTAAGAGRSAMPTPTAPSPIDDGRRSGEHRGAPRRRRRGCGRQMSRTGSSTIWRSTRVAQMLRRFDGGRRGRSRAIVSRTARTSSAKATRRRPAARRPAAGRCRRARRRQRVQRVRRRRATEGRSCVGSVMRTPRHLRRPRMRVAHPGLDCGKVRRQTLGHLDIGQAVVIRQLDAFALGVGQRVQAFGDLAPLVERGSPRRRRGRTAARRWRRRSGTPCAGRLLGAHPVDRACGAPASSARPAASPPPGRSWRRCATPAGRRPAWFPRCSRGRAAPG